MSKENNISILNRDDEEELFERMTKGHENFINFRKKKLFKRTQLINSINNYYKHANNFKYLPKNQENKKIDSFSNIKNFTTIKKPNNKYKIKNITLPIKFSIDKNKENVKKIKKKVSHLYIDSYEKKVKFSIPNNLKQNISINQNLNNIDNEYNINNSYNNIYNNTYNNIYKNTYNEYNINNTYNNKEYNRVNINTFNNAFNNVCDKTLNNTFNNKYNNTYNNQNKIYNSILNQNKININFYKEDNKNEENTMNTTKSSFKKKLNKKNKNIKFSIDMNTNINSNTNINTSYNKERSKSISLNITDNSKNLITYFNILPSRSRKKRKLTYIFYDRKNNEEENNTKNKINKTIDLTKKNKSKQKSKAKYSNNFVKDCICKQILNNPNLKILYQTNEYRIKKNIKSQSKANKNKFNIIKYQTNLMKNTISPLNDELRIKLIKSFSKLNNYIGMTKKINLQKYLNEIQSKEKKIIKEHNNLKQNYINNIKKIGLLPEKNPLILEKIVFKNIFKK